MTDAEFIAECRRGIITILAAFVKRFGVAWLDFLPKAVVVGAAAYSPPTVTAAPEYGGANGAAHQPG